jgi:hypothetical protein
MNNKNVSKILFSIAEYKVKIMMKKMINIKSKDKVSVISNDKELLKLFTKSLKGINYDIIETAELRLKLDLADKSDVILIMLNENVCFNEEVRKKLKEGKKIVCCPRCNINKLITGIIEPVKEYNKLITLISSKLYPNSDFKVVTNDRYTIIGKLDHFPPFYVGFEFTDQNNFIYIPPGIMGVPVIPESVNGTFMIDGFVQDYGPVIYPIILTIENGLLVKFKTNNKNKKILEIMKNLKDLPVCELGLGFNPQTKTSTDISESESEYGIVDLGFGENKHIGGPISGNIHFDITTIRPTLFIDNRLILKNKIFA